MAILNKINKRKACLIVGIGALVCTIYSSIKATIKSKNIVEEYEYSYDSNPTRKTILKLVWKYYIPTACFSFLSAYCMYEGYRNADKEISKIAKTAAASSMAYGLKEAAFDEYKKAVKDKFGEEVQNELLETADKNLSERQIKDIPDPKILPSSSEDGVLCYDMISGRFFNSSINDLREAENLLNRDIIDDGFAALNRWYELIGLDPILLGEDLGWQYDHGTVSIRLGSRVGKTGAYMTVGMDVRPIYDYGYRV